MEITNQMKQQLNLLDRLEKLVREAEEKGLTESTTPEDRKHLKNYCQDMIQACRTSIELEKVIEKARKAEEAEKEEAAKKAAEEKNKKAAAEENKKAEDDLSFLD